MIAHFGGREVSFVMFIFFFITARDSETQSNLVLGILKGLMYFIPDMLKKYIFGSKSDGFHRLFFLYV